MITHLRLTFVIFALDFIFSNLGCVTFFWAGANLSVTSKFWGTGFCCCSDDVSRWARREVTTGSRLAIVWSSIALSATVFTISWICWRYVCMAFLLPCKARMSNKKTWLCIHERYPNLPNHTCMCMYVYNSPIYLLHIVLSWRGCYQSSRVNGDQWCHVLSLITIGCCCLWKLNTLWACLHRWPCWKT